MSNRELAERIKNLRNLKGFSQEELANESGLSLRTIQRIEKGKTEPRGDSLKKLANAFDVPPEDITDWTIQEDNNYLIALNLSSLCVLLSPLFGILFPFIMWISKKDKIKGINKIAKELINFLLTWSIPLLGSSFYVTLKLIFKTTETEETNSPSTTDIDFYKTWFLEDQNWILILIALINLYVIVFIIINSIRIYKNKNVKYYPKIGFLKIS